MARRRKLFRFKIKSQTIYTIFAILLISAAAVTAISFFQSGTILERVNTVVTHKLGWGAILLPIVLVGLSLLFIRIKSKFTKPNISIGLLLSYICLLTLTQSGQFGQQIWNNFASLVSSIGAFIILSGMFLIGLIVLFNTSIEELVKAAGKLIHVAKKYINPSWVTFSKKPKPMYLEKLPIRSPSEFRPNEKKVVDARVEDKPTGNNKTPDALTNLSTSLITNLPNTKTVWEYPPTSLLAGANGQKADRGDMKHLAHVIEKTLESFGITAKVVEVNLGPAVTQYSLDIAMGTKLSKITALSNDLALALAAPTGQIRIEAPIPGRSLVGIEIPNRSLEFVTLKQMLFSDDLKREKHKLMVALGLDVSGKPVTANIAKMPHVLIAGTTGSGKSVLINTWISSLLFRTTPAEVRLILVDPKRVELIGYNGIPHLLTPVIVEADKILSALKWALSEMERRYKQFAEVGVRNIDSYNELAGFQALPYIVILIDELADLMAYAPVEVEDSICRLAQMARATGMHLVIATQRPSVDVITGLIKANIPSRIAFNVSSMIDSRVILDSPGAEKLLGRGDMLYIPPDQAKPTRIQGTFVSDTEVQKLVEFLKSKNTPVEYTSEVTSIPVTIKKTINGQSTSENGRDPLFEQAVRVVCQYDRASASLLQRRLSIGYARAARILDRLEEENIISPGEGAKPRDVLIHNAEEFLSGINTTPTANTPTADHQ